MAVPFDVRGWDTGMCWGWSQKGKGDHSRFFVLELGMILVELELKKEKKRCEFTFSTLVALVLSGVLLGMGPGTKQGVRRESLQEEDLWDPQEMGQGRRDRGYHWCSAAGCG